MGLSKVIVDKFFMMPAVSLDYVVHIEPTRFGNDISVSS